MTNNKEVLQDWLFQYNPYTNIWNAFKREHSSEYWNNSQSEYVLKSEDINVLVDMVIALSSKKK
jgi:hypothetical protein